MLRNISILLRCDLNEPQSGEPEAQRQMLGLALLTREALTAETGPVPATEGKRLHQVGKRQTGCSAPAPSPVPPLRANRNRREATR